MYLSLLLALVPVVHFALLALISYRRKTLAKMRGNYAIMYLDWLFVPFNALMPFVIAVPWWLIAVFAILATTGVVVMHRRWHAMNRTRPETAYFMDARGLTPEGWVHFCFMVIEGPLIFATLVSPARTPLFGLALGLFAAYLLAYLLIIRFVRRVALRSKAEFPVVLGGFILVAALGVWWFL